MAKLTPKDVKINFEACIEPRDGDNPANLGVSVFLTQIYGRGSAELGREGAEMAVKRGLPSNGFVNHAKGMLKEPDIDNIGRLAWEVIEREDLATVDVYINSLLHFSHWQTAPEEAALPKKIITVLLAVLSLLVQFVVPIAFIEAGISDDICPGSGKSFGIENLTSTILMTYLLASSASRSYEYSNRLTWLASGFSGINSYLLEIAGFLNFSVAFFNVPTTTYFIFLAETTISDQLLNVVAMCFLLEVSRLLGTVLTNFTESQSTQSLSAFALTPLTVDVQGQVSSLYDSQRSSKDAKIKRMMVQKVLSTNEDRVLRFSRPLYFVGLAYNIFLVVVTAVCVDSDQTT